MDHSDLNFYRTIKTPVVTQLKEILKHLKKDDLMSYAMEMDISGRSKMNKEKLTSELYEYFLNPGYLEYVLLAATKDELLLFRKLCEVSHLEKGDVTYGRLRYFTAKVIIFLFLQDNSIYMVIPDEFKEAYLLIDQTIFSQKHKRIDELHKYILAMNNLYGFFTLNMPFDFYNKKNSIQISYSEYIDILYKLASRNQYFYIYDAYIVNEYYELPHMQEELAQMLKERKGKPYYIPGKNEIFTYADNLYQYKTPEFIALKNFMYTEFDLKRKKADSLLDDIAYSCSIGESIESIMSDVTSGDVIFDGKEQLNEFLRLITDLSNNSRLWINKGHTPKEIFEKYEKPNLRPLPNEPFKKTDQPQVQSEKVGRNQPCPCGSGKKYKNCCGR